MLLQGKQSVVRPLVDLPPRVIDGLFAQPLCPLSSGFVSMMIRDTRPRHVLAKMLVEGFLAKV